MREHGPEAPFSLIYSSYFHAKNRSCQSWKCWFSCLAITLPRWVCDYVIGKNLLEFQGGELSVEHKVTESRDASFHCYRVRGMGPLLEVILSFVYYSSPSSVCCPCWLGHPYTEYCNGNNGIRIFMVKDFSDWFHLSLAAINERKPGFFPKKENIPWQTDAKKLRIGKVLWKNGEKGYETSRTR